ncbi:hypothetical protein BU26DRAFT_63912 [Trematosphaeria pertusa]|uniref:Uncharacterized protein n=1 Tax=Trematosphaeria pertusa TaxID=390896 RepID=A0A6A6I770_9PLEO|nr:uncharacterized protein BU26DRAFT_63912 [Trematosphaeria pertusa]KAF2246177.1 hypothetical protein BU26DRAFT_63912 [Trematosphaeria pertusa]
MVPVCISRRQRQTTSSIPPLLALHTTWLRSFGTSADACGSVGLHSGALRAVWDAVGMICQHFVRHLSFLSFSCLLPHWRGEEGDP